jgi:hypothetical protein
MRMCSLLAACLCAGALLHGCEQVPAPFDTTGDYAGTWSGTAQDAPEESAKQIEPGEPQIVEACPLSLSLTQNVAAPFPGNFRVDGTVTVDYGCVELPLRFETPPPATVNVGGFLQEDGSLTLLSGGCGTGFCVVLTMDGAAADTDDDGFMDTYSGDWSYLILLAGVMPFGFEGTFETALAE